MASTEISFIPDFDQLDQDIQDEDFETTVNVGGAGGGGSGLSPSQRNQQESVVAGGVSRGLLAVGVFAGILSQLKSVTAIISAVLGAISRALIPVVESLADELRPFVEQASNIAESPQRAIEQFQSTTLEDVVRFTAEGIATQTEEGLRETSKFTDNQSFDAVADFLFGSSSADQSGEATKQQLKQNSEDAGRDRLGAQR